MPGQQNIAGDALHGQDLAGQDRRGDWTATNSGIRFWPLDPRPSEVRIDDIAHSLSQLCRFGGHCNRFYSVAEHSLYVAQLCPPEHRLWGLLHDASEAYAVDIPRPLKRCLPDYRVIEGRIMAAIAERFGLSPDMPQAVKEADESMLTEEAWRLMSHPPLDWGLPDRSLQFAGIDFACMSPARAKKSFLYAFDILTNQGAAT